ncbi:MAG TPA: glycosyl hydrolase 108 family protein [Rhizomicrobium sp.]
MIQSDDDIVARILLNEGGYVNDPADHGGATNFGITAAEWGRTQNLGRAATPAEMQALTRDQAIAVYKADYIAKPGFDAIPDLNLRMIVVDSGVLHGVGRAAQWLQTALGVAADGAIGNVTKTAMANANACVQARKGVVKLRIQSYGTILNNDHTQVRFAAGWLNRAVALFEFF